jgi:predicted transposase YbfD/YdcC
MEVHTFFADITDPRIERCKKHLLCDIIGIALCGMIAGAEGFEEMEDYAKEKELFLRTFLELPNGIPSHDTVNRVFQAIDPKEFAGCLVKWGKEIVGFLKGKQVCLDGKTLRGTGKGQRKSAGIVLLSAWVSGHGLTIGQGEVDEKSNEIKVLPEVLKSLDLDGALVSVDAMGCQREVAAQVIEQKGDYLLALKGNQGGLHQQVQDFMQRFKNTDKVASAQQTDIGHGRIETRRCFVCNDLSWIDNGPAWKSLTTLVMVEGTREFKHSSKKAESETRYYISSRKATPEQMGQAVRNHWGIENQLHWYLDVAFDEDLCRVRTGNAAQNLSTLRKIVLQLLLKAALKGSVKRKRLKAAWNDEYMEKLLKELVF